MKGWGWCAIIVIAVASGCAPKSENHASAGGGAGPRVIEIAVTDDGFDPREPEVRRGEAVTLAITRKTDRTCAVDAIFPRLGKHVDLPMNQTVRVEIPAGAVTDTLYFACGMNMVWGMVRAR
jgi:plastocyanin domain-containing protein